jgi:hypothetical protein
MILFPFWNDQLPSPPIRSHGYPRRITGAQIEPIVPSKGRCFPALGDAMMERLETATGDYLRASDVLKSHEPLVDACDLVAYAFKE